MSITEIAQEVNNCKENILLIYAFNATGKTMLSVAYKNLTKDAETGKHAGVYYNAYSEDLFKWDNDEPNDNLNVCIEVIPSSLNDFHSFLIENPDLINDKLAGYKPNYHFRFNPHPNPEDGIKSITFSLEEGGKPIKISRGEERIFIWCFFLALFEVEAWAGEQDAHFFIDDPVSSLDDNNIFITADSIFDIVEKNYLKKRIIVTTHHISLYSILFDRFRKGEKSGRYRNLTKPFILTKANGVLELKHHDKDVFLFHLHLLKTLDAAIRSELYIYHFVLLRQLLETISSFLGSGGIGYALAQLPDINVEKVGSRINSQSHQNAYKDQFNEMTKEEREFFEPIVRKVVSTFKFKF